MKVAIVTRSANGSPRVLAESLAMQMQLPMVGVHTRLFYKINTFKRLLKYKIVAHRYSYTSWLVYKLIFVLPDRFFLKRLRSFDVIIISDCSPLGFFLDSYDIERLRKIVGSIPLLFYEVYYLGNTPTQLEMLKKHKQPTIERYNWHLSVSDITEIRSKPASPWSHVGLYLKGTGLRPNVKKDLLAVVDFLQPGYEHFRNEQIKALEELKIPYLSLENKYTIEEIRSIYQQSTFYFMQSSEAFGLPIAECLCCGSYVFTPDSSWPMSWRLDENPIIHGKGLLPDCFVVYDGQDDLKKKLLKLKEDYDFTKTPKKVFETFFMHYPFVYEGNQEVIKDLLERIKLMHLQ